MVSFVVINLFSGTIQGTRIYEYLISNVNPAF